MTHRNVQKEDFVGKTVVDLDCAAVNILRFKFADGTTFALEADILSSTCPVAIIQQCDHCGDFCEYEKEKLEASFVTIVDDVALRSSIRLWLRTTMLRPSKGQDLYLLIIAHATQLPYEEVLLSYSKGDTGILAARRKTKRIIFAQLCTNPAWTLALYEHDAAHEPPAIQSGYGPQAAENHPR